MERIDIIGNLVRDPESRVMQDGRAVCNFTVAVNRRVNGADVGMFYEVSAWDKLGENCYQYLAKGRKVYVSGRPDAAAWTGRDGKAHAGVRVLAQNVEFLSARGEAAAAVQAPAAETEVKPAEVDDDELPF